MKTDLTTSGSFAQSQALSPKNGVGKEARQGKMDKGIVKVPSPDYKLDLSSKTPVSVPSLPSPVSAPSVPGPSMSLVDGASTKPDPTLKDSLETKAQEEVKEKVKTEVTKIPDIKDGSVKRPAIFFVKGLDIFSSPLKSETGYSGLGRMAESVEGSRLYGWDQKDEIIKEIRKIHPDYPVILVGHSLGGDTAIEVADELDNLKEKFRSVDLLITIDAIGFGHDIIPQNVKQHLNVFGEKNFFLSDGPHVARRDEKTVVKNILSPLDHTDIDDDRETQFEIMNLIQKTLNKKIS